MLVLALPVIFICPNEVVLKNPFQDGIAGKSSSDEHPPHKVKPYTRRYETSKHLWLILEYCVGGDLMSLLCQDIRLPEASIHDFARDVALALQVFGINLVVLARASTWVLCLGTTVLGMLP